MEWRGIHSGENAGVMDAEDLGHMTGVNAIGAIHGTEVSLNSFKQLACDGGGYVCCDKRTICEPEFGRAGTVFGLRGRSTMRR